MEALTGGVAAAGSGSEGRRVAADLGSGDPSRRSCLRRRRHYRQTSGARSPVPGAPSAGAGSYWAALDALAVAVGGGAAAAAACREVAEGAGGAGRAAAVAVAA